MPSQIDLHRTRIVKRMAPNAAGTKKLVQRFGADLVCVRYRHDEAQGRRYTTVELLVDAGPLLSRPTDMVHVRLGLRESRLRKLACKNGAVWDAATNAWKMRKRTAKLLHLMDRLVAPPALPTGPTLETHKK